MPGQTALGYPYPLGTDRVMDGDDVITGLANAVNDKLGVFRAGTVTIPTPDTTSAGVSVTFPVGVFTAPPAVGASVQASAPQAWGAAGYQPTASGMQVRVQRSSGATATTALVSWWAGQVV